MFLNTALVFAAFASTTLALPKAPASAAGVQVAKSDAVASDNLLKASAAGGLYFCVNAGFAGPCRQVPNVAGQFLSFTGTDTYQDSISAIGPDPGIGCQAWVNSDGTGDSRIFHYPGVSNLDSVGFNDRISSITCWWE